MKMAPSHSLRNKANSKIMSVGTKWIFNKFWLKKQLLFGGQEFLFLFASFSPNICFRPGFRCWLPGPQSLRSTVESKILDLAFCPENGKLLMSASEGPEARGAENAVSGSAVPLSIPAVSSVSCREREVTFF